MYNTLILCEKKIYLAEETQNNNASKSVVISNCTLVVLDCTREFEPVYLKLFPTEKRHFEIIIKLIM